MPKNQDPKIQSRQYLPNPSYCCPKCVFNQGRHADFCPHSFDWMEEIDRLIAEAEHDDSLHIILRES